METLSQPNSPHLTSVKDRAESLCTHRDPFCRQLIDENCHIVGGEDGILGVFLICSAVGVVRGQDDTVWILFFSIFTSLQAGIAMAGV